MFESYLVLAASQRRIFLIESNFRKAFLPHCEICPIAQLKDFKISNTFLTNLLTILDSLVVRISACHVEGPGSIPGRGVHFFFCKSNLHLDWIFSNCTSIVRARVAQSVER